MVIGCKERHVLPLVGLPQKPKVVDSKEIFKSTEDIPCSGGARNNLQGGPNLVRLLIFIVYRT